MSSVILTKHARERLQKRTISEDVLESVIAHPDQTFPGQKPNTIKFIRTINGRNIQLIGTFLPDEKKWLIVSAWVRGENDQPPIIWQFIILPFKIIKYLLKF